MSRSDVRVFGVRRRGDLGALDAETARHVLHTHGALVWFVIHRMRPPGHCEREELAHLGRVALLQAWVTHDPTQSQFSTWAVHIIRQALYDFFAQRVRPWDAVGDEPLTDAPDDAPPLDDALEAEAARQWLRRKLANGLLTDRERVVMHARLEGAGLADIGARLGVSRERVRQIEREVVVKLQKAAVSAGLRDV